MSDGGEGKLLASVFHVLFLNDLSGIYADFEATFGHGELLWK